MNDRNIRPAVIFGIALLLLYLAGSLVPGTATWGFHALSYLHSSALIAFGLAAVLVAYVILTGRQLRIIDRALENFETKPVSFLALTLLLFGAAAFLLRVRVPLLGDSFILIKLYQNTFTGGHPFPASHQPLSLFFFYEWAKLFGSFTYPQILDVFLHTGLVLGCTTIVLIFYSVRELFHDAATRCSAFCILLALPSIQLFFGYVEIYAAVVTALVLYIYVASRYLNSTGSFHVVAPAFLLLLLTHYLNALLLPSLVYLAVLEYRKNGIAKIITSAIILGCVAGAVAYFDGGLLAKLVPPARPAPFLSVMPSNDIFQAYTLVSLPHATDLANLLILLFPAALFLIAWAVLQQQPMFRGSDAAKFLFSAIAPIGAFLLLAKFDLPMAQDWDVAAVYALPVLLFALVITADRLKERSASVFGILGAATIITTIPYVFLNSTVEPNLRRVESFLDPAVSSHDGCYQSALHLTEYYVQASDTANIVRVCEKFIRLYPADSRGYSNYTLYLQQFGKPMDGKIDSVFGNWLAHDPESAEAKEQYANFHLDAGNRSYREGDLQGAKYHLLSAVRIQPSFPDAYNSLGIVYRKLGDTDSAIILYKKTVELDPKSVYAYINLGNLYDDIGNSREAIVWYNRALVLTPGEPTLLYNLGIAYYKGRSFNEALDVMRRAARGGERDAQAFLTQRGEQW